MVQSTDVRHAHDDAGWLYNASERGILVQRVRSNVIVVGGIGVQRAAQVRLVEDDQMIETLAADGSDQSLDVGVLPWAARSNRSISNAH